MNVVKKLKGAASHALTGVIIGGFLGYLVSDWTSFNSAHRDLVKTDLGQVMNSEHAVDNELSLLSLVANGTKPASADQVQAFNAKLRELRDNASDLTNHLPSAQSAFDAYDNSIVDLNTAARTMTGPGDGKQFVEAVSKFLVARNKFHQFVADKQNHYFSM